MLYWIYHKEILLPGSASQLRDERDLSKAMQTPCGFLAKLWVLADFRQMIYLRQDVLDAFIRHFEHGRPLDLGIIPYVYENTIDGSCGLRRLLRDFTLRLAGMQDLRRNVPEFLVDCFQLFVRNRDFFGLRGNEDSSLGCDHYSTKLFGNIRTEMDDFDICRIYHDTPECEYVVCGPCNNVKPYVHMEEPHKF